MCIFHEILTAFMMNIKDTYIIGVINAERELKGNWESYILSEIKALQQKLRRYVGK